MSATKKLVSDKPRMVDGLLVTDTTIFSVQKDGTVLICDANLPACKFCNVAHAFFVRRDSKTRCTSCDAGYRKSLTSSNASQ